MFIKYFIIKEIKTVIIFQNITNQKKNLKIRKYVY